MENMPTTQELAQAMQTMQNELRQAISQISNLQNALNQAKQMLNWSKIFLLAAGPM